MARMLAIVLGVLALGVATPAAADLTGDWTLGLRPDFGGVDEDIRCTVKQDGAMLTADCGGAALTGSVEGQAVTLNMKTNAVSVTFAGTLDQAGTTITGKWHFVDSDAERTGNFTFTKASR